MAQFEKHLIEDSIKLELLQFLREAHRRYEACGGTLEQWALFNLQEIIPEMIVTFDLQLTKEGINLKLERIND
jgi:hypothetical protein